MIAKHKKKKKRSAKKNWTKKLQRSKGVKCECSSTPNQLKWINEFLLFQFKHSLHT